MSKLFKIPSNLVVFLCSGLLFLLPGDVFGQTAPVLVRDPTAVSLASRALQGLTGGTVLHDITLQANATYIAGSDQEMGPATLVALGNQQSLVTLNLSSGQRQEIRSGVRGVWVGADGAAHTTLSHNTFVDAAWFCPAFTLAALASDRTLAIRLVGQEIIAGEPVYHLVLYRVVSRKDPNVVALIARISTMQLYLDAATLRPAALDFNIHPDQNTAIDIPVEVRFGAYQSFSGVQTPTRIQKYIQNSPVLDLSVVNAAMNSGVPAAFFAIPNVLAGGAQ